MTTTVAFPPTLENNLSVLKPNEVELAKKLVAEGQEHLFADWPAPGVEDFDKHRFFEQVDRLERSYPGGIAAYIRSAKNLLAASREGKNPFEGYTPKVPKGEALTYGDDKHVHYEEVGIKEARDAAFVLVAGGLGERLGYSGIKIALMSELTTESCFLQQYIAGILALEDASHAANGGQGPKKRIPLAIMTSDDTHARTLICLETHNYFGMDKSMLTLMKQEKVACLSDNDAHIALEPHDKYAIQTKPHGHGDVHSLLYHEKLLEKWHTGGYRWVVFFQDTNALIFKAVPSALGVSKELDFEVNSLAVPRKAKEAIGAIAELHHVDGSKMTINVEYNQLDPLLRATVNPEGDVNDPSTGLSPYPGNINQLVFKLDPYIKTLARTHGMIQEFVNPKYKDATKTVFKASTRLECMMQDYPKSLPHDARVGFTVSDVWVAYSPVKNSPDEAIAKVNSGLPPHSAASGELDQYIANCKVLGMLGATIGQPSKATFNGIAYEVPPRVVLSPSFALTYTALKSKVNASGLKLATDSTLVIDGPGITIDSLEVEGTLVIRAVPGANVKVSGLKVKNAGWHLEAVNKDDEKFAEDLRVRGFQVIRKEGRELKFDTPGDYVVSNE
eukprot:jgi/Mesvir1/16710/Mv15101-RA.1